MIASVMYLRRTFAIRANQVQEENIREIADWCKGTVAKVLDGTDRLYVLVPTRVKGEMKWLKAYMGDWVTCSVVGTGFKVYPDKSFKTAFETAEVDEKKFTKVQQLVLAAMARQDQCTFHGVSAEGYPFSQEITRLIMKVV